MIGIKCFLAAAVLAVAAGTEVASAADMATPGAPSWFHTPSMAVAEQNRMREYQRNKEQAQQQTVDEPAGNEPEEVMDEDAVEDEAGEEGVDSDDEQ